MRDFYPHYEEDEYYEVPDAIAELLREFERKEKNYIRKIKRYRAYFSLDFGDRIEIWSSGMACFKRYSQECRRCR